jgi:hypothetical protein
MKNKNLVNKNVKIVSDNENYIDWIEKNLVITFASNSGNGYDESMYPQMLCDLADADNGEDCPFALYEYEFNVIN